MARMILGVSMVLLLAPAANAADGVLEINQACAVNTGCFSGDDVGFPVEIDGLAGRSYRLTSDLVVPADTTGIEVDSTDTSIDLGGFEIVTAACLGATSSTCVQEEGSGDGISVSGGIGGFGPTVKNGSVVGFSEIGISAGVQAQITNVRARWNGSTGISVGVSSTVSGNTLYENFGSGIYVMPSSTISNNAVYLNGNYGIECFALPVPSGLTNNVMVGNASGSFTENCLETGGNVCGSNTDCP